MTPDIPDAELDELEQKLDHLQEGIDDARREAEDHRTIPGKHEQTLADPDGDGDDD